jgi:hypothetical protein
MKKSLLIGIFMILSLVMAAAVLADAPKKAGFKAGDEVYVCNCGESCDCLTMSRKEGACVCKKPMVKAKVASVEKNVAMVKAADWEKPRAFKTVGKFACACGPTCDCGTISQKAGNCTCGKPMKAPGKKS